MVTVLSPVWGLRRVLVYGAQKSRKAVRAPLYTEAVFHVYNNRERNLCSLVDLNIISIHENVLSGLEANLSSSLMCEIIMDQRGGEAPAYYTLLTSCLDRLDADNIARFMPNLAAGARKAVTAIAYSQSASEAFRKAAFAIASAFGSAFILPEKMFPAFIGLSGSGIAYVFQFVHALAMGAVEEGIPYTRAVEIAGDTLESAFTLLRDSRKNPVELASMVCSAGGTTIRGMNILSEQGFDNAVIKAVRGATERSIELEKSALESKEND